MVTDMPRCRTCKRWQQNSGVLLNWGTCRGFREIPGVDVECDEPGVTVTVDTHETFGCVEHEEKP